MLQSQTLFKDLNIGDTFALQMNELASLVKTGYDLYTQENDSLVRSINPDTPVFKIATHNEPEDKDLRCFALDKAIHAYAPEGISPINMVEHAQVFYEFLLNGNSKKMNQENKFNGELQDTLLEWAKVSDIAPGAWVKVYGIPCIGDDGTVHLVHTDNDDQLYINCSQGTHILRGQKEADYYVGIVLYEPEKAPYVSLKKGTVFKLINGIEEYIKLSNTLAYAINSYTTQLMPNDNNFEVEYIS